MSSEARPPGEGSRAVAADVDAYFARLPAPAAELTGALRDLVRAAAPELTEELKWGAPAYLHPRGVIMLVIAAYRAHANIVFTPSTKDAFAADLTSFVTGKGSIRFPYGSNLPTDLLERMIRFRINEYERGGVTWM